MAANKKPRKRYKPRGLIYDPVAYIKQGFAPLTSMTSANVDLRIKYHNAMAQIQTGNGVMHDIDTLIAASNMAMGLKKLGMGGDWEQELDDAANAIIALRGRYRETGRVVCRAGELKAINLLLAIHDAQLDASTIGELEQAIKIVKRKEAIAV